MTVALVQVIVVIVGTIIVPLLVFMVRMTAKWTSVETRLDAVVDKLDQIVKDKDKDHIELQNSTRELAQQMAVHQDATDRRLRWLEEHLWLPKGR